ncbi:MAG: hypothetical protein WCC64_09595 [Aliidongia sp.]
MTAPDQPANAVRDGEDEAFDFIDRPSVPNRVRELFHYPLQKHWPVSVLGQVQGRYYFLTDAGEVRALHFSELTKLGVLSLFGGRLDWFDGAEIKNWRYRYLHAAQWLIEECSEAGVLDGETVELLDSLKGRCLR